MMKTTNTGDLRRSSIMPGKGQIYKKPMKKMKRDPYAEGVDPSAGRGVPVSAYREARTYGKPIGPNRPRRPASQKTANGMMAIVPKPKRKPQVVNRGAKSDKSGIVMMPPSKKMKKKGK